VVFFPGGSVTPSEDVKQKYLVVQIQSIRKKIKHTIDAKTGGI